MYILILIQLRWRASDKITFTQRIPGNKNNFSSGLTRQREGWGKNLCSVIEFHSQRHLTIVDNILSYSACVGFSCLLKFWKFLLKKMKNQLGTFNIILKLNPWVLLKWMTNCIPSHFFLTYDCKSCLI